MARSHCLSLVLDQDLHHMNTIMTCEPWCTAQHLWTFPVYSVYGRSSNLYSDKTSDNSGTEEPIIFFLRDSDLFNSLIASTLKEITQFAGTSYQVTSTRDYTLMPMGLHHKKWSTNCEVHLCSATILFPPLKLEDGTLLFISIINHVLSIACKLARHFQRHKQN